MDKQLASSIYYRWFASRGVVSKESAKHAARAFYGASVEKPKNEPSWQKPEDILFWPLVISGVVSFAGNGKFAISPPVAYKTLSGKTLEINNPDLCTTPHYSSGHPGLELIDRNRTSSIAIKPKTFDLSKYLPLIPDLKITSLIKTFPLTQGESYRFEEYPKKKPRLGKTVQETACILSANQEPGSKKALYFEGKEYRIAPNRSNPDAYALARLFVDIQSGKEVVAFDPLTCIVTIKVHVFPVELRKLLLLESVTVNDDLYAPLAKNIFTLRKIAFTQFQQIFTV